MAFCKHLVTLKPIGSVSLWTTCSISTANIKFREHLDRNPVGFHFYATYCVVCSLDILSLSLFFDFLSYGQLIGKAKLSNCILMHEVPLLLQK